MQELRAEGYLPAAIRNYLALLGWGAGDDATVISTQELTERFSLERVSRNPARFDETKLRWLNGLYIRALPVAELARQLAEYLAVDGPPQARDPKLALDPDRLARAAAISQEKMQVLAEFWPLAGFLFVAPHAYDEKARSAGSARTVSPRWPPPAPPWPTPRASTSPRCRPRSTTSSSASASSPATSTSRCASP